MADRLTVSIPAAAREPIYGLLPKVTNFPQQHRAMLKLWIDTHKTDPTFVKQVEAYLGPEAAAKYWENLNGARIPIVFLKRGAAGIAKYHEILAKLSNILASQGYDVSQTKLLLQGSAGFVGASFHQGKIEVTDGKISKWNTYKPESSDVDFVIFFQNPKDLAAIHAQGLRSSTRTYHISGQGTGYHPGLMDHIPGLRTLAKEVADYLEVHSLDSHKVKFGASWGNTEDTLTGVPEWGSSLPAARP